MPERASRPIPGHALARALTELWALPERCIHLSIDIPIKEPATVTCTFLVSGAQASAFVELARHYMIQEIIDDAGTRPTL
jgi:hypothetical protein